MKENKEQEIIQMIEENKQEIDELNDYIDHLDIIVYISIGLNILLLLGLIISFNLR